MVGVVVVLVAVFLAAPAGARAQAPANDARTAPERLSMPAALAGTTRGSSLEPDEPEACVPLRGSFFYELTARSGRRIVVQLQAAGDLDAVLDVFRRTRSSSRPSIATSATDAVAPSWRSSRNAAGSTSSAWGSVQTPWRANSASTSSAPSHRRARPGDCFPSAASRGR